MKRALDALTDASMDFDGEICLHGSFGTNVSRWGMDFCFTGFFLTKNISAVLNKKGNHHWKSGVGGGFGFLG